MVLITRADTATEENEETDSTEESEWELRHGAHGSGQNLARPRAGNCNHEEQGDQMSSRRHYIVLTSTTGEFGDREMRIDFNLGHAA